MYRSLEERSTLRLVIEEASDNTSGFWRYWFGSSLARFLCRVKREHAEEFDRLLDLVPNLFDSLNLGHKTLLEEKLFPNLDFSTPGRLCSGLAFVVHLLDRWNEQTDLSPGYTLDFLTLSLWKTGIKRGRRLYDNLLERHPSLRYPEVNSQVLLRWAAVENLAENPRAGLDPPQETEEEEEVESEDLEDEEVD